MSWNLDTIQTKLTTLSDTFKTIMMFIKCVSIAVGLAGLAAVPFFINNKRKSIQRELEEKDRINRELESRVRQLEIDKETVEDKLREKQMQSSWISKECLTLDGKLRVTKEKLLASEQKCFKLEDDMERLVVAYNELVEEYNNL